MFTISELIGQDKLNKLKEQHDKYARKTGKLETEIINSVFNEYIEEDERKNLLQKAKAFNFSSTKLSQIENTFKDFNEDNIDYNTAVNIIEARKHIKEHDKESFFTKMASLVISEDEESKLK